MTAVYAVVPVPARKQAVAIGHQKLIKGDAMNNNRPIARSTRRFATLFLAGAAAVAALGAGPSLAQADRYDRGRDRDDRFRDNRVDVRVDERRERYEDRRVWVEPIYRTVSDRVWVEPVYRTEVE